MSNNVKRRNIKGFSLLELLIVVSIITILTALGTPALSAYMSTWRLNTTGRDIYSNLLRAKNTAVRRNTRCVVEFTPGEYDPAGEVGSYRIYLDTNGDWTDQDADGGDEEILIEPTAMPGKVSLQEASFTDNGNGSATATTMAGFDSRGRVARAVGGSFVFGRLVLQNDKNRYRRITVTLIGSVFLEKSNDGVTWKD